MKILYLAHRIPYPPNKGDKIRSFNEIKCLSASHEIHLLALADTPGDLKYQDHLKKYCTKVCIVGLNTKLAKLKSMIGLLKNQPLSVSYFYSKLFQKALDEWFLATRYDAVICFSSPMAEYLFRSPVANRFLDSRTTGPGDNGPVFIMDYCDLDSEKWNQYAQKSRFPLNHIYSIENKRLFKYEKKINQEFTHSVFVSQTEVDLFRSLYPAARNLNAIPNGVDHGYFSPSEKFDSVELREKKNQPVLVFTGAMDYYANIDGVIWFCHEIFPQIKDNFPDTLFYIVGSNPSSKVKALESIQGVKVTGFVEDIRPYYHFSDVCVIPLQIAAGVQNKVLEAMSMGKAVVTTATAYKGIQEQASDPVLVEDTPIKFAHAVISLLNNAKKRICIGKKASHFIREKYNWKTNMNQLETLISFEGRTQ